MSCPGEKVKCVCDKLTVDDYVTVVFENGRVVSGKIVYECMKEKILVLQTRCRKCIYINADKVAYICRDCRVVRPCNEQENDIFCEEFEL